MTVAGALAGCSAPAAHQGSRPARALPRDPQTAAALVTIATVFINDYGNGIYGPVYDRWDARSKAIITKAEYVRGIPNARRPQQRHAWTALAAALTERGW